MLDENWPKSWTKVELGTLAQKITKGATPTTHGFEFLLKGINFIKIENVKSGVVDVSSIYDFISEDAHSYQSKSQLKRNDVLFSIAGTIGETVVIKDIHLPANTNQAFAIISGFSDFLIPKFLEFQLRSFVSHRTKQKARGGAMNNVSLGDLKELEAVLPPLNEQHRIVAKIEELFSEIDKGVESLQTAKAQLQVYRQALLKHAFEGKLTAQWRADNPDKVVPAAQLLSQIKQAREERYQQQLADWKTAVEKWELGGQEGKKPLKPKPVLMKLETDQRFIENKVIPNEWTWSTLEELLEYVTSGSRGWADYYSQSGSVFVRAQNLKHDRVNLEDVAYVDLPGSVEGIRSKLKHNDILITITGANVTKTGIVQKQLSDAYISQHVALCRLTNPNWSEYVYFYLLSEVGGRKQLNDCAYGAGKPGLNLENIKSVTIPFCSYTEQLTILSEIKSQYSVLESLTTDIENELRTADALRQSILKKAFSGQLVPQDPNDEPASQLLARIQAEKAAREAQPKPKATKMIRKSRKSL